MPGGASKPVICGGTSMPPHDSQRCAGVIFVIGSPSIARRPEKVEDEPKSHRLLHPRVNPSQMSSPVPVFKSLIATVAFKQIPLLDMRARTGNDTALVTQHAIAIRTSELRRRKIGCSRVARVFGHGATSALIFPARRL